MPTMPAPIKPLPTNKAIRVEISKAVGKEGRLHINQYLAHEANIWLPLEWDWSWTITSGPLQGTLPKRIASWARKNADTKLTPKMMEHIGNLAAKDLPKLDKAIFSVTRDLNWLPGFFGDAGSCYWESHFRDRILLNQLGCYAILTYAPERGRAWLLPISMKANKWDDGLVIFNGYGYSSGSMSFAKLLLSQLPDWNYASVDFDLSPSIYVNTTAVALFPPHLEGKENLRSLYLDTPVNTYYDDDDEKVIDVDDDVCNLCLKPFVGRDQRGLLSETGKEICAACIEKYKDSLERMSNRYSHNHTYSIIENARHSVESWFQGLTKDEKELK